MIDVRASDFLNYVEENKHICALFYSHNSVDSKLSREAISTLDKVSQGRNDFGFVLVKLENDDDCRTIQISKVPQFRVFIKGTEVKSIIGVVQEHVLSEVLDKVKV
jgi:thioredoxin-like negative regulator of GroEL